ncbi:basic proline-rich protein-like [Pimephales promelas]|uniref:basic proline-rich protein-like n=1 Tax=Pimephales promelas TaxID=90988 RepID=UPI00195553E9|nr:basic proline-rich protein-like [Pimephales promelas]
MAPADDVTIPGENRPYLRDAKAQRAQIWVARSHGGPRSNQGGGGPRGRPLPDRRSPGPPTLNGYNSGTRASWTSWVGSFERPRPALRSIRVWGRLAQGFARYKPKNAAPLTGPNSLTPRPPGTRVASLDRAPRGLRKTRDPGGPPGRARGRCTSLGVPSEPPGPRKSPPTARFRTLRDFRAPNSNARSSGTRGPRDTGLGSSVASRRAPRKEPAPEPRGPRVPEKRGPTCRGGAWEGKVPGARGRRGPRGPVGSPRHPKGRAAGTSPLRDTGRFLRKSPARNGAHLGTGRSQRLAAAGAGPALGDLAPPAVPGHGDLPVPRYGHFLSSFDRRVNVSRAVYPTLGTGALGLGETHRSPPNTSGGTRGHPPGPPQPHFGEPERWPGTPTAVEEIPLCPEHGAPTRLSTPLTPVPAYLKRVKVTPAVYPTLGTGALGLGETHRSPPNTSGGPGGTRLDHLLPDSENQSSRQGPPPPYPLLPDSENQSPGQGPPPPYPLLPDSENQSPGQGPPPPYPLLPDSENQSPGQGPPRRLKFELLPERGAPTRLSTPLTPVPAYLKRVKVTPAVYPTLGTGALGLGETHRSPPNTSGGPGGTRLDHLLPDSENQSSGQGPPPPYPLLPDSENQSPGQGPPPPYTLLPDSENQSPGQGPPPPYTPLPDSENQSPGQGPPPPYTPLPDSENQSYSKALASTLTRAPAEPGGPTLKPGAECLRPLPDSEIQSSGQGPPRRSTLRPTSENQSSGHGPPPRSTLRPTSENQSSGHGPPPRSTLRPTSENQSSCTALAYTLTSPPAEPGGPTLKPGAECLRPLPDSEIQSSGQGPPRRSTLRPTSENQSSGHGPPPRSTLRPTSENQSSGSDPASARSGAPAGPVGPTLKPGALLSRPTRASREPRHCARLESSSTGSSFPADSAKPVPLAVVSLDSSSKPAARRRPRQRAGWPPPRRPPARRDARTEVPTRAVAAEIREKGPAHVQSRRRAPRRVPPRRARLGAGETGDPAPPPDRPRRPPAKETGEAGRVEGDRAHPAPADASDGNGKGRRGSAAPPAAARAQPRFAPQPDRPSP